MSFFCGEGEIDEGGDESNRREGKHQDEDLSEIPVCEMEQPWIMEHGINEEALDEIDRDDIASEAEAFAGQFMGGEATTGHADSGGVRPWQ